MEMVEGLKHYEYAVLEKETFWNLINWTSKAC